MSRPLRAGVIATTMALSFAFALAACPGSSSAPRGPATVDLSLRMRQSCGLNLANYQTSCLAAMRMVVRKDGDPVQTRCAPLSEEKPNLLSFLLEDEPYLALGTLTTQGKITIEIQGLTDVETDGGSGLCELGNDPRTWLFFGESAEIDLATLENADAGALDVEIAVDCRDCEGGCAELGSEICPVNPLSFCVPGSVTLNCEKPCENDDDCFEGALTCDTTRQRCSQSTATPGQYCAVCRGDEDCETELGYFCVGLPGETTGLCAYRCPDERCLTGTRCNRIYNDLRLIGSAEAPADVDGGTSSGDGGAP